MLDRLLALVRTVSAAAFMLVVSSSIAIAIAHAQDAPAQGAPAQDQESAEQLLKTGLGHMAAKRFGLACAAIRKSYRLDPQAETLFHLAGCEEKAGHIATAAIHYEDYLDLFDKLSPEEQRAQAEHEQIATARREWMQREIPRVIFRLSPDAPANTVVTRRPQGGGEPVKIVVGVPLPIDPGQHFIAAEVPGRPRWEQRFSINRGEQKIVSVEVAPASSALKPAQRSEPLRPVPVLLAPLDPPVPGRRIAAYAIGGVGIAGIVTGVVSGAITWAQKSTIHTHCRDKYCNPNGEAAKERAAIAGVISTVGFSVGGACLATGVILYLTEPAPTKFGKGWPVVNVGVGSFGPGSGSAQMGWVW